MPSHGSGDAAGGDEQLALRATQGDRRAFEAIYGRYHQALYRFCLAMVGNPQDAQDALQNTMVKVLRALPGEKREIRLKPWLYRIARNESVETLRRRHDSDGSSMPEQSCRRGGDGGGRDHESGCAPCWTTSTSCRSGSVRRW